MPRAVKPGPGHGMLFDEIPTESTPSPENFSFLPSDYDPPATSLADYYTTLAGAVKAIARGRSAEEGFSKLSDSSKPVKEFAYRFDSTPEEAKHEVVKAAKKHYHKAQDILNKRSAQEYRQISRFAELTDAYSIEFINDNLSLPPSYAEVKHKYFEDPNKTSKQMERDRARLYGKAKRYTKSGTDKVA